MDEHQALVLPGTGQVVNPNNEVECVQALVAVRDFEQQIREAKSALTAAVVERARVMGTKTIHLPNGSRAEIKGGQEVVYDAQQLETELRALGMPEDRIRQIVREEVTYKVNAQEAKRAAAANPEYAAVVESNSQIVEKPHYLTVSRNR